MILLSKIPRLNNFFKQINNITSSCVEDNKLECSNDITITNNCSTTSTSIQFTASSSDQSVVDVNDESEKSELNVIILLHRIIQIILKIQPIGQIVIYVVTILQNLDMIRTLMQILPHQNELILIMIVIVVNQSLRKTEKTEKMFRENGLFIQFQNLYYFVLRANYLDAVLNWEMLDLMIGKMDI